MTLIALDNGVSEICLPVGSTRAIEDVVLSRGAAVRYTRNDKAEKMKAMLDIEPASQGRFQAELHFDALFAMAQVLILLTRRQLPLRTIIEDYPQVYRRTADIPVGREERGRVLRLIRNMEASAEFMDGLYMQREGGFAWLNPNAQNAMRIVCEARDDNAACRLCESYSRLVREIASSPDGAL